MPFTDRMFNFYENLLVQEHGYAREHLQDHFAQWQKKFGDSLQTKRDFLWSKFNELIAGAATRAANEEEMYRFQKKIYLNMLRLQFDEGKGERTNMIRKLINFCDLKEAELLPR